MCFEYFDFVLLFVCMGEMLMVGKFDYVVIYCSGDRIDVVCIDDFKYLVVFSFIMKQLKYFFQILVYVWFVVQVFGVEFGVRIDGCYLLLCLFCNFVVFYVIDEVVFDDVKM